MNVFISILDLKLKIHNINNNNNNTNNNNNNNNNGDDDDDDDDDDDNNNETFIKHFFPRVQRCSSWNEFIPSPNISLCLLSR